MRVFVSDSGGTTVTLPIPPDLPDSQTFGYVRTYLRSIMPALCCGAFGDNVACCHRRTTGPIVLRVMPSEMREEMRSRMAESLARSLYLR